MQTVTTVRFDSETIEKLDGIASALDRPRAWVVKGAVKNTWIMRLGFGSKCRGD